MIDCGYCSRSFDDEKDYIKHLKNQHIDSLGSIDQKRVEEFDEDSLLNFDVSIGVIALLSIIILTAGFTLALVLGGVV